MFHCARALLFQDGIKERSHECIPLYLKANYPELISDANTLDAYRRFRHRALYGLDSSVNEKDAIAAIHAAEKLLSKISTIIKK